MSFPKPNEINVTPLAFELIWTAMMLYVFLSAVRITAETLHTALFVEKGTSTLRTCPSQKDGNGCVPTHRPLAVRKAAIREKDADLFFQMTARGFAL